jgi:hypothetical protein
MDQSDISGPYLRRVGKEPPSGLSRLIVWKKLDRRLRGAYCFYHGDEN